MNLTEKSLLTFNSEYITADGKPWFPIMGEIHYSRVKEKRWETELLKMKAGGVEIVSTYCIWIHHEEIEGEWDFSGQRDLHRFIDIIKKCGLYCILRIGPWAHGEVRNGGFPDWLVAKEREGKMQLRSNDHKYLEEADRFYKKIFEQVEGYFLKDGGPIIGIQIENEYGHCGGLTGEEGEEHMKKLLFMAKEAGFDVPLYTATGWGGAVTGGMLPVMGGYCEAPWDQRLTEIEPSGNYVFTEERNDHNIGSDHGIGEGITFDPEKFPYLTAELGGGLQVTKHRRPIATAKDIAAMSMVKLGSGCNLLGYYMYHGGTNPKGKQTTLQESKETGYLNDLPILSYDFNAPIREYGQLSDTYREIRRLTMFTRDYQELLCSSDYIRQPGNTNKPDDFHTLRTAVRTYVKEDHTQGGFYFLNNYQRRYEMDEHKSVTPTAFGNQKEVLAIFDTMDVKNQDFFVRPFGLKIGEAFLKTTNAIPLCILNKETPEAVYVFYVRDGVVPDYRIKGTLGKRSILTLTDEEALHASRGIINGKEYLFLSEGDVIQTADGGLELFLPVEKEKRASFRVWPELDQCPDKFKQTAMPGKMYQRVNSSVLAEYKAEECLINPVTVKNTIKAETEQELTVKIQTDGMPKINEKSWAQAEETILTIAYEGESAELYQEKELVADNFYTGQVWEIGICDLLNREELECEAKIYPLTDHSREEIYLQEWPKMENGRACRIHEIHSSVIYRISIIK